MTLLRKIFSFATITLVVALTLSSIAAWYSIQGLMAIFAAAVVPIMIMGGSLELAKVVATIWLHRYWDRCGWALKLYLVPSVVALALLTSMGIFGFLSKAHSSQSLVTGDVGAKIAVYDTKIQTARENIEANRKALSQIDAQVDQLLGRTTDEKGANRAVQVRRQQAAERKRLTTEIAAEQQIIADLQDEAAPIRAEVRKVEAEVGPIKYIAAMIYGDNPDSNLLERAVRWVIVLIVFVFDPLALTLALAAQSSYRWLEEDAKKEEEENKIKDMPDPEQEPEEGVPDKSNTPEWSGSDDTAVYTEFLEGLAAVKEKPIIEEEEDVPDTRILQEDMVEIYDGVGETLPEAHLPDADEPNDELEPSEEEPVQQSETVEVEVNTSKPNDEPEPSEAEPAENVEIQTEGVTLHEIQEGYYDIEGKSMSKAALLGMRPELFSAKPESEQVSTNFGTEFPRFAKKSDIFVRIDVLPNKVFKFDGYKWIEINKESSDSYLYDEEYLRHLVSRIESGEYDIELLSENEKVLIEEYLQRSQS